MSLRIAVAVLVGLLLFLVSHILAMTLLEVTPDEMPTAMLLLTYIIIEGVFALAISHLTIYIAPNQPHKPLLILISVIGIITLPALLQTSSKWSIFVTYFWVLPIIYYGRFSRRALSKSTSKN